MNNQRLSHFVLKNIRTMGTLLPQILEKIHTEFIQLREMVSPLLVNYVIHKHLKREHIDHKFKTGYYNDYDNKESYKYLWIEHDGNIYDMTNYINDQLLETVPRHRDNSYLYNNSFNRYTTQPTFSRVDINTQADKDYNDILDHIYVTVIGDNDEYANGMPTRYKKILKSLSE